MVTTANEFLTLGQVAQKYGCQAWQVLRLFTRGILPEAARVGRARVVHVGDLPAVEKALRECGYIGQDAPAA